MATYGDRKYMKGFAFRYLSPAIVDYVLQELSAFLKIVGSEDAGSAILLEAHPYSKMCSVPLDATAFANRGDYMNCTMAMRWTDPEKDEFVRAWTKTFVEGVKIIENRIAEEKNEVVIEGGYANMDMPGDKAADAFKSNFPRLQEIKKKWDPTGRFNKWFPITAAA
jgi:FAD/FMN-containing dehydrogenase